MPRRGKSIETEADEWLSGHGEGKWGLTTNENRVSLWNDRNVLKLDSDNDCYRRMVALHKSDTQIREVFHILERGLSW